MRSVILSCLLILGSAACGDDEKQPTDTKTDTADTADTGGGDSAADTTPADTAADTTPADTADTTPEDTADTTPADTVDQAKVARGSYIVEHVAACVDCHAPRNADGSFDRTKFLSGIDCFVDIDPDPNIGCLSTANLTNHETGLANYSDAQIKALFTEGKKPDGKFLTSFMPYWALGNMTDEDADAIVAFLRTVPGIERRAPAQQPPWTSPPAATPRVDLAILPLPRADYPDMEAAMRGRYLTTNIGACLDCHTQSTPPGSEQPRQWDKAFQGGEAFPRDALGLPPFLPEVIYTMNLTPHETGLGAYTVEDIVKAIKQGISKDGTIVCPPMPAGPNGPLGGLTDEDALDIAHFLHSLEPKENVIPNGCGIPVTPQ